MQIACGGYHSIVLTIHGNLFAFGSNRSKQIGIRDMTQVLQPIPIQSIAITNLA